MIAGAYTVHCAKRAEAEISAGCALDQSVDQLEPTPIILPLHPAVLDAAPLVSQTSMSAVPLWSTILRSSLGYEGGWRRGVAGALRGVNGGRCDGQVCAEVGVRRKAKGTIKSHRKAATRAGGQAVVIDRIDTLFRATLEKMS